MVDRYGRIKIPKKILKNIGSHRFVIVLRGGDIVLKPLQTKNLKNFFDFVEVNAPEDAFRDYSKLKKYLLRSELIEVH